MKKIPFIAILCCLLGALSTRADGVYIIPIEGEIGKGMLCVLRRAFREARELNSKAVILDVNTPGGAIQETREIITWIRALKKDGIPVYSYVNPDALSAGAMICLATNAIYMAENGTIGSAMPIAVGPNGNVMELSEKVEEKILSAVRAMVKSLAQENGYREDVAIAMVDPEHPDLLVGDEVVCPQGHLLNFTARDATKVYEGETRSLLARAIASDVSAVCDSLGFSTPKVVSFKTYNTDLAALWITRFGPLLLGLGTLFLLIEYKTPGFGFFGISGIVMLCVYFFGHHIAGLANMTEIILFALGLVLLALEIFVIPGFGITGITGIILLVVSIVMAVVPSLPKVPELPGLQNGFWKTYAVPGVITLAETMLVAFIGAFVAAKLLPHTKAYNALVLNSNLQADNGYVSVNVNALNELVGKTGTSLSVMRPAGIILVDGKRIDAVSDGDFIPKDTPVRVISVNGSSVIVKAINTGADA